MKFKYKDAEYSIIDPDGWSTLDAVRVQENSGRTLGEIIEDWKQLGALGLHAFAWVALRRAGVDVSWDGLDLPYLETLKYMDGNLVQVAPDPSTASTRQRKPGQGGGPKQPAVSAKK